MPFIISKSLPCLLCGNLLDQRTSKRKKPYFICNPCGVQLFIRRELGINHLEKLYKTISRNRIFQEHPQRLLEIQRLLAEINGIRAEITKIDQASVLFLNREETRMRDALQKRLDRVLSELEQVGEASE